LPNLRSHHSHCLSIIPFRMDGDQKKQKALNFAN